jgi:hypothetical protein
MLLGHNGAMMMAAAHPSEFRKFADTCDRMAITIANAEDRASLHDMADAWRRLAEDAERFEQLLRDADQAFEPPHSKEARSNRRSH